MMYGPNMKIYFHGPNMLRLASLAGRAGSLFVSGPIADNAPNTLGNYDCGYTSRARVCHLDAAHYILYGPTFDFHTPPR